MKIILGITWGNAYVGLKQFEKAVSAYKKAIKIKPDYHKAWFKMGYAYVGLKQSEKAVSAYKKAAETSPTCYESWFNIALSYTRFKAVKKGSFSL